MAKKIYKTYHLRGLQVLLFDEMGCPIEVNFKGGVQIDSTAKFSTNDEKVQNALEKCSGFNRDFYLDSVREDNPATPVVEKKKTTGAVEATIVGSGGVQTIEVGSKADAIEWLKDNYPEKNYTAYALRGEKAFAAACDEVGVKFEFTSK